MRDSPTLDSLSRCIVTMSRLVALIFAFHVTFSNGLTSPIMKLKAVDAVLQEVTADGSGSVSADASVPEVSEPPAPSTDDKKKEVPLDKLRAYTKAEISEDGGIMPPVAFENEDPQSDDDE